MFQAKNLRPFGADAVDDMSEEELTSDEDTEEESPPAPTTRSK